MYIKLGYLSFEKRISTPFQALKLEGPDSSANFGISSNCFIVRMQLLGIIGFGLSAIRTFGLAFSFRLLLPRNVIPHVSAALDEVVILLDRAEDINALPNASEYRATLAM